MKFIKLFFWGGFIYFFLIAGGTEFSSCQKTVTEYDTVTKIKKDTVIKTDTLTILDSLSELKQGLVAYYNFNNGNLDDSSGYGNSIIFSNATKTTDRFGRPNNAYLFDGSTSYMQVHNSASLNPTNITIMAIVKFNGYYEGLYYSNEILMKGPADQAQGIYGIRVGPSNGNCCTTGQADTTQQVFEGFYGDNGTTNFNFGLPYFTRTNTWATVVMTYDGFQSRMYVNGALKSTLNGIAIFTPNTNDLYIGKTENPLYPFWFNGVIDELRIYNKALGEDDVRALSSLTQ